MVFMFMYFNFYKAKVNKQKLSLDVIMLKTTRYYFIQICRGRERPQIYGIIYQRGTKL